MKPLQTLLRCFLARIANRKTILIRYLSPALHQRVKNRQRVLQQQTRTPLTQIKNKCYQYSFFILLLLNAYSPLAHAQADPANNPAETEMAAEAQDPMLETEAPVAIKTVPDTHAQRVTQLKAQYPAADIRQLSSSEGNFNALWREDQSGEAFGAILIVPTDGQTANWPHSIDVLRTELPLHGWSTLAIDIEPLPKQKIPKRPSAPKTPVSTTENNPEPAQQDEPLADESAALDKAQGNNKAMAAKHTDTASTATDIEDEVIADKNTHGHDRIKAGLMYLHEQGQYNVIVLGYGNSARRVLQFAQTTNPEKAKKRPQRNADYPLRAIILINPSNFNDGQLSPLYDDLAYKSTPILDVLYQTHYLDYGQAKARKLKARSLGFKHYIQVRLLEPSTTIFSAENQLSRRIRGFLDRHAKGVEVGGR